MCKRWGVAIRGVAILGLVALLSGCGFHARGTLAVADQLGPVRVVAADTFSPLAQTLATALVRAGAVPAVDGQPSAQLRIVSESLRTLPLTVDEGSLVREYVTRYTVAFRLDDAGGGVKLAEQTIELSRDYTFDNFASAGNPAEQELVEKELRRDMLAAILRRLDVGLRANP